MLETLYSRVFNLPYRMVTRFEFFAGFKTDNERENKLLDIITLITKKFIWDCKLRYKIPNFDSLLVTIKEEMAGIGKRSRMVEALINCSSLFGYGRPIRF